MVRFDPKHNALTAAQRVGDYYRAKEDMRADARERRADSEQQFSQGARSAAMMQSDNQLDRKIALEREGMDRQDRRQLVSERGMDRRQGVSERGMDRRQGSDQAFQSSERDKDRAFTREENQAGRAWTSEEAEKGREFTGEENEKQRAHSRLVIGSQQQHAEKQLDKQLDYNREAQKSSQEFQSEEARKQRWWAGTQEWMNWLRKGSDRQIEHSFQLTMQSRASKWRLLNTFFSSQEGAKYRTDQGAVGMMKLSNSWAESYLEAANAPFEMGNDQANAYRQQAIELGLVAADKAEEMTGQDAARMLAGYYSEQAELWAGQATIAQENRNADSASLIAALATLGGGDDPAFDAAIEAITKSQAERDQERRSLQLPQGGGLQGQGGGLQGQPTRPFGPVYTPPITPWQEQVGVR